MVGLEQCEALFRFSIRLAVSLGWPVISLDIFLGADILRSDGVVVAEDIKLGSG